MQERFLVSGKAGSGKTHLVLQKFFHFVEKHKEDNVIFILPTHSQVEHLRGLTLKQVQGSKSKGQGSKFKGYLDTGLVSFSILANKILDRANIPPTRWNLWTILVS